MYENLERTTIPRRGVVPVSVGSAQSHTADTANLALQGLQFQLLIINKAALSIALFYLWRDHY